jgi:hypothetical protein
MRKLALLAAICAAAFAATAAGAATPERLTIPIQDTFYAPFMSNACGVPVTITLQGTANVLLQRNEAGLVVREHDVMPSFTAVFESPNDLGGTGESFTQHSPAVTTYDYGAGATIGSIVVVTSTGLGGQAAGPGTVVSAGLQRVVGTVVAFSPEGIPIVDFDGPTLTVHGHWPVFDLVLAQRCEALGGSLQP